MTERFRQIIGIVGNPMDPGVSWSDDQLAALKGIGIDTLQLSIAWNWKPANEVLNIEDLDDPAVAATYQERVRKAHRHGFRTAAHFGIPKASSQADEVKECICDAAVIRKYQEKLKCLFVDFETDDVMIYTYDQGAWLCSEFGACPNCSGVPLAERLTPFLESLVDAIQEARPGARLWWEPWELSEGQIIAIVDRIRPDYFGIIMHSNIAEVNFTNTTDLPFRNIARASAQRGIPVIGEGFFSGSGEDIETIMHMPCPRLVYQQLDSMSRTAGLVGIKEYYGFSPSDHSANVQMLESYLRNPNFDCCRHIAGIAETYGRYGDICTEAWELAAQGMELFPFNAAWQLRFIHKYPECQRWKRILANDWLTPSWKSSRKAYYMITTNACEQHPWLLEDVGLRAMAAAKRFEQGASLLAKVENQTLIKEDIALQKIALLRMAHECGEFGNSIYQHRNSGATIGLPSNG